MKIKHKSNELTLTYETKNNFMVDILVKENKYEAWIYKKNMNVKQLMFKKPRQGSCSLEIEYLIEEKIEEHMIDYEMNHCYEGKERVHGKNNFNPYR